MAKVYSIDNAEEWRQKEGEEIEEYFQRQDYMLQELQKASDALPNGEIVGALISFPVANGGAYYQIVEEKPLSLIHIPFSDENQIPDAHARELRASDVRHIVDGQRKMAALFAHRTDEVE